MILLFFSSIIRINEKIYLLKVKLMKQSQTTNNKAWTIVFSPVLV